jgi:hypothetical protein
MPDLQIPEHERYREAIDSVRKRVPVPREVWDQMQYEEREHAFTVAQVTRTQVLQQVLDSIDKAVTTGTAITDFRAEVADKLIDQWGSEIPGRIETIFRTNIGAAYAEGRHAINSAPAVKEARPIWRYNDVDNDRECELCHDCHGVVLPADHPWWLTHHPLLHFCCCCEVDALTPEEAAEEGYTSEDDIPDVEADEGFGHQPSSEGEDWAPDLTNIDPELRAALEAKLDELKGRGWGVPEPAAPAPAPRGKPEPDEAPEPELPPHEKIASQVEAFEDQHVDRKTEIALIMDGRGEPLLTKPGGRSQVSFTASEVRLMRDGYIVHNHPSGSSLSPADLNCAMGADAAAVAAIGRDRISGTVRNYSFNRPSAGWPTPSQVHAARLVADRETRDHLVNAVIRGTMTPAEAAARHWHEVWTRVQNRVDIGYKATEREGKKRR